MKMKTVMIKNLSFILHTTLRVKEVFYIFYIVFTIVHCVCIDDDEDDRVVEFNGRICTVYYKGHIYFSIGVILTPYYYL